MDIPLKVPCVYLRPTRKMLILQRYPWFLSLRKYLTSAPYAGNLVHRLASQSDFKASIIAAPSRFKNCSSEPIEMPYCFTFSKSTLNPFLLSQNLSGHHGIKDLHLLFLFSHYEFCLDTMVLDRIIRRPPRSAVSTSGRLESSALSHPESLPS